MSTSDSWSGGSGGGGEVGFTFDGRPVRAQVGQTVAMALWANGIVAVRASSRDGSPRGVLCNMGICYECLVRCDGTTVRACLLPVRDGLAVERGGRP